MNLQYRTNITEFFCSKRASLFALIFSAAILTILIFVSSDLHAARLSVGSQFACTVTPYGGVRCWGNNDGGQLGNGTATSSASPVDVIGLTSGVAAISTGSATACALTLSGGVKCWGSGGAGNLGNGTTVNSVVPVDVQGLTSGVLGISVGDFHACAVTTSKGVKCWGYNNLGQLGNSATTQSNIPVDVVGLSNGVEVISVGFMASCAVLTSGVVKCWGDNRAGGLGDGTQNSSSVPVTVVGLTDAASVSVGSPGVCAVTTTGVVKCWGTVVPGQGASSTLTPLSVLGLTGDTVSVAVGSANYCSISSTNIVECWGTNNPTQELGSAGWYIPSRPLGLEDGVAHISHGSSTSCALMTSGQVKCWGFSGNGSVSGVFMPGPFSGYAVIPSNLVGSTTGVAAVSAGSQNTCVLNATGAISCGGWIIKPYDQLLSGVAALQVAYSTCVILTSGRVNCFGSNVYSALGVPVETLPASSMPIEPTGLGGGIVAITGIDRHYCALNDVGAVRCWGKNDTGQIGDGTVGYSSSVVLVNGLSSGVRAISAGPVHSCAVMNSGSVKCWGGNSSGQLGNGTRVDSPLPVGVTGVTDAVSVSAGDGHTCVVTSLGAAKCWGANGSGQLGNGTGVASLSPVVVTGLSSNVTAIRAGYSFNCALTTSGGVKCWGYNQYGQLGNGTIASSLVPTATVGLSSGVVNISAGYQHACAVMITGTAQCWGQNSVGQLGNGGRDRYWNVAVPLINAFPADSFCQTGSAINPIGAYTLDLVNGTALDTRTGLLWDQCPYGLSGVTCTTGTRGGYSYDAAKALAAGLSTYKGQTGWRVPTITELKGLVETCRTQPTINTLAFPNTISTAVGAVTAYWSGELLPANSTQAKFVSFGDGFENYQPRTNLFQVRLVRSVAPVDVTPPTISTAFVTPPTWAIVSSEAATAYWIVIPRGAFAPSKAQVKAGVNYSTVTVASHGTTVLGSGSTNVNISGLATGTPYDVYLMAEDAAANQSAILMTPMQFGTNGACGTAAGVATATQPTTNLCASGTTTGAMSNPPNWTWTCVGSNMGTDASCSAPKIDFTFSALTPRTLVQYKPVMITVSGTNLPPGNILNFSGCQAQEIANGPEVGTSTKRFYYCFPTASGANFGVSITLASQQYFTGFSVDVLADADRDGIPDAWENTGVPQAGNVKYQIELAPDSPAAPPDGGGKKDIFLWIDEMNCNGIVNAVSSAVLPYSEHFDPLRTSTLKRLVDVFDRRGIRLHIYRASTGGSFDGTPSPSKMLPCEGDVAIGTNARSIADSWKQKTFINGISGPARARVFHYLVYGHSWQDSQGNTGSTGVTASGLNLVFISGARLGTEDKQLGTMLHEFGHALGLDHNGPTHVMSNDPPTNASPGSDKNFKPAYLSVMNYLFQTNGRVALGSARYDFSDDTTHRVWDENDLSVATLPQGIGTYVVCSDGLDHTGSDSAYAQSYYSSHKLTVLAGETVAAALMRLGCVPTPSGNIDGNSISGQVGSTGPDWPNLYIGETFGIGLAAGAELSELPVDTRPPSFRSDVPSTIVHDGAPTMEDSVALASDLLYGRGVAGGYVRYVLKIQNNSEATKQFAIQTTGNNWPIAGVPTNVTIGAGTESAFEARIFIPSGTAVGSRDKLTITVSSVNSASTVVADNLTLYTNAATFLCDLDINGDGTVTADKDGVLLNRYLLGYTGDALVAGVPLGVSRSNAALVASFIGSGSQFDVFGRTPGSPVATTDGLVLTRLMLGVPDSGLLTGISPPPGAQFVSAADVRVYVNSQCATHY